MADDDDGDDGEDDGDEGEDGDEGDEEDSEMPDGESGAGFRAESEAKTDHIPEASPSVAQTEPVAAEATPAEATPVEATPAADLNGTEPPPAAHRSPPPGLDLPPSQLNLQHMPSHFEGSPLKNVVAAASPTDSTPKIAPNDEKLSDSTNVGSSGASLEPNPDPVVAIERPSPVVALDSAKTDVGIGSDVDVEMWDVPHPVETETTVQSMASQEIRQPDVASIDLLPHIDSVQTEEVSDVHRSPPPTTASEIASAEQPIVDSVSQTAMSTIADHEPQGHQEPQTLQEPQEEQKSQEPSATQQALGEAAATTDPMPAPEAPAIDTKVEPVTLEGGEENEPESPDLFSGLEAALNQQGRPKEEPVPPETKTDGPL